MRSKCIVPALLYLGLVPYLQWRFITGQCGSNLAGNFETTLIDGPAEHVLFENASAIANASRPSALSQREELKTREVGTTPNKFHLQQHHQINKTNEELNKRQRHKLLNDYYKPNTTKEERKKVGVPIFMPWSLPEVPATMKSSQEFMRDLNFLKRKHGIPITFETNSSNDRAVQLPYPILVMNLPKSGTTSLRQFFECGNISCSHTFTEYKYYDTLPREHVRIGDCLRNNLIDDNTSIEKNPPLDRCTIRRNHKTRNDRYIAALSDIGTCGGGVCFYSSLHDGGLEHIADYYPNATIVLMTRDASAWFNSLSSWNNGSLLKRWVKQCKFGSSVDNEAYWTRFYHAHTEKIRRFARSHLSMTYIEVELNNMTSLRLEHYTSISSECFKDFKPNGKLANTSSHSK